MGSVFVVVVLLAAASSDNPLTDPTDVRGVTRGAAAVGIDPAGAARAEDFELSLRSRLVAPGDAWQWGLYGVAPLGSWSLLFGYEWLRSELAYRRATLGLGLQLSPALSLGLEYHHLGRTGTAGTDAWDVSLRAEPATFVSLALGVEQLNGPRFAGLRMAPATWVGVGLRPFLGASWLTIGAEAHVTLARGQPALTAGRAMTDFTLFSGAHAQIAYQPHERQVWLGVGLALENIEIQSRVGSSTRASDTHTQAAGALTWRNSPTETIRVDAHRVVTVPLTGDLKRPSTLFRPAAAISEVPLQLDRLAHDSTVSSVILDIGELELGAADLDELRAAIHALRAAGKRVTADLASGSEKNYLVAAAADRVRLDPAANLTLNGFAVTLFYLADALAKIGVRFEAVAIGRYKTGPDSLVRAGPQPAEREMIDPILWRLFRTLTAALVEDRHLDPAAVEEVLRRGAMSAPQALALGLVDELSQPTDPSALPRLRASTQTVSDEEPPPPRWGTRPVVLVVPVTGNITASGAAGLLPGGSVDTASLIATLDQARLDANVLAVVLRIDSPGGEVYAAELIWRAVRLLAAAKPVVVSMANVAASGGYYIATPAAAILAEPTTITGSIGIYMVKPDLSGLLALAGIHAETMQIGPHAGSPSIYRPLSQDERATAHDLLMVAYNSFLDRVASGRHLPRTTVAAIAEGHVYTGERALELGLVDGIGGLTQAIAEARARAGLAPDDDAEVRVAETTGFSWSRVIGAFSNATRVTPGAFADILMRLQALGREPLARLPFEVQVTP